MKIKDFFKSGIIDENPVFIQLLGMCPTLATSTSLINAVGMGLSATFVLVCSNMLISLLRKIIPQKIRIASYISWFAELYFSSVPSEVVAALIS